VRVIPAQLRFRFERRIVRDVPVEARFTDPREGYAVASYQVVPAKLTITGPESSVERTTAVVTDRINISGVLSTSQFHVNSYLSEPQVRFQSPSQVDVRVVVKKK
jgi:YbbR domain-containing protein